VVFRITILPAGLFI